MSFAANFFVITGGPGAGKTALVEALRAMGFAASAEAGRRIIKEQVATDGSALPWRDRAAFADAMLSAEIASYRQHAETHGLEKHRQVIFDRGIPDVIGYLCLCGLPVPVRAALAAENLRYNPIAFLCPPWREIFAQDAERRQDFAEAERTDEHLRIVYADLDYHVVEVPKVGIAERMVFVRSQIEASTARLSTC